MSFGGSIFSQKNYLAVESSLFSVMAFLVSYVKFFDIIGESCRDYFGCFHFKRLTAEQIDKGRRDFFYRELISKLGYAKLSGYTGPFII